MDFYNDYSNTGNIHTMKIDDEDALNDETFGAAEICDWEKEHEKLAEFDFSEFGSDIPEDDFRMTFNSSVDKLKDIRAFGIPLPEPPTMPNIDDEEDAYSSEINLEEALRKLVADDEEVLDDPAIVNITKRPPGQSSNFQDLLKENLAFGFPSTATNLPVNLNESKVPNAAGVWTQSMAINDNIVQTMPQPTHNYMINQQSSVFQEHESSQNIHTNLINSLLEQSKSVSMPKTQSVRTVNDIECEIFQNSSTSQDPQKLPTETNINPQSMQNADLKALQGQLLQNQLLQQQPQLKLETLNTTQTNKVDPIQTPEVPPNPKAVQLIQTQWNFLMRWANQALSTNVNPQEVQQTVLRNQQQIAANAIRLGLQVPSFLRMPMPLGVNISHPRSSFLPPLPQRMLPPGLPPHIDRPFLARAQFQMLQMMRHPSPQFQPAMLQQIPPQPSASPVRPPNQDQYRGVPEWASPTASDNEDIDIDNIDPEKGDWMTPSEKDWLAKIQVKPLEVDNPYVQDYYWTIQKLRQLLAQRQEDIRRGVPIGPHPVLSLIAPVTADQLAACSSKGGPGLLDSGSNVPPQMQDSSGVGASGNVTIKPYKVIQFENCLGKLTVSSIYFPRQVIDVPAIKDQVAEALKKKNSSRKSSDDYPRNELQLADKVLNSQRAYRFLLLTIEKLFGKLLQVDEFDVSIGKILVVHNPNRVILETHRNSLVQELVKSTLQISPRFSHLFTIKKGCRFFSTMLSHLDNNNLKSCLKAFIKNFDEICSMKNEIDCQQKEMFRSIYSSIKELNLHSTTSLLNACWKSSQTKNSAVYLAQHQLGFSIIMALFERFSIICNSQDSEKFRYHCEKLASRLKCLPDGVKCTSLHNFSTVSKLIFNHMSLDSQPIYQEKVCIDVESVITSNVCVFNPRDLSQ